MLCNLGHKKQIFRELAPVLHDKLLEVVIRTLSWGRTRYTSLMDEIFIKFSFCMNDFSSVLCQLLIFMKISLHFAVSHVMLSLSMFSYFRYTASTVLSLLHEICCSADPNLNWSVLAKNSNSGINNAKEYQSLWRHLAYRTNIPESFEDDALPLVNSLSKLRF